MKSVKFIFFATVTLICSTCFSQDLDALKKEARTITNKQYELYDNNNDKILTKEEVKGTVINRWFGAYDFNKDGVISTDEFEKNKFEYLLKLANEKRLKTRSSQDLDALKKKARTITSQSFKLFDINNDGILSVEESKANEGITTWFGAYDFNKDGSITKQEFLKNKIDYLTSQYKKKKKPRFNKTIRKTNYIPKPRFKYETLTVKELFKKFDVNGNDKIEREEAKTENSFNTDFSRMDKNGDEEFTKKELKKYLESK